MADEPVTSKPRFHVLLTEDRPHGSEHWSRQLPMLLAPMGIEAHLVTTGREAIAVAERVPVHAAVIDLATPLGDDDEGGPAGTPQGEGGLWLVDLFRRLPHQPAVVVLRGPALSKRQAERMLTESLRLGAFSVLNKPVDIETLLAVFRRVMDRRFRGQWPMPGNDKDQPSLRTPTDN